MSGSNSNQKDIATGVIAAAEDAVASLGNGQGQRANHLRTLTDLFVVVEQRYHAMHDDLQDRDARIQALEETNELLIKAITSLTQRLHENAHGLNETDTDLARVVERSEALVSSAFGSGGNANPTRAPDAPPYEEVDDGPLEDLEWDADSVDGDGREPDGEPEAVSADEDAGDAVTAADTTDTAAPPDTDEESTDDPDILVSDDLVFEEAPTPEPDGDTVASDDDIVSLDVPEPSDSLTDTDLVLEDDDASTDGDGDGDTLGSDADEGTGDGAEEVPTPDEDLPDSAETEPLAWSDAWSVGAPDMDGDHRILVNLINTLPQALHTSESDWIVGSVLNSLWDYACYHFDREEALLRAANFPGSEDHAARHDVLKAQARDWLERYQADPESVSARALLVFLKGWLMNHVLGEDMRYKPYVENNPDAQSVAAAMKPDPTLLASVDEVTAETATTDP
jgi:hemerythrin-like metal-binding protein